MDRPDVPMIALSRSEAVVRQMNLLWGVYPFHTARELKFEEFVKYAESMVKKQKLARKNDYLIILSGLTGKGPSTNSIVVHQLK